jgi:uncharacterized integral membrane protein (TIGR00697 family)
MEPLSHTHSFKLLNIFTGIFVGVLVLVPSMSAKFIALGPFNIAGSTLIFPITYIFNDIFTEVYGYKRSRKIIWIGMGMQVFAAVFYWLIDIWQPAPFWHNQDAYHSILGQAPRIVVASLSAYFLGEFANSFVISKMKFLQNGKRGLSQGWRFVVSTVVGEGFDSFIFMSVAFAGIMANNDLIKTILTIWAVKVLYEIIVLPFTIRFSNYVKKIEGVDIIDTPEMTSYNPFNLK